MVHRTQQNHSRATRRKFLTATAAVSLTALAGCSSEEVTTFEDSGTTTLQPGDYHAIEYEVPEKKGPTLGHAISYEVNGDGDDTEFGVYIFKNDGVDREFDNYEEYVAGETDDSPSPEIAPSKARIDRVHSYDRIHQVTGDYVFVIDNTEYQGWGGVQGHGPTESELEVEYDIEVHVDLPKWAIDRA